MTSEKGTCDGSSMRRIGSQSGFECTFREGLLGVGRGVLGGGHNSLEGRGSFLQRGFAHCRSQMRPLSGYTRRHVATPPRQIRGSVRGASQVFVLFPGRCKIQILDHEKGGIHVWSPAYCLSGLSGPQTYVRGEKLTRSSLKGLFKQGSFCL